MTLLDIITASLQMLERGTDAHTIENYRAQFTKYANDAVDEILRRIKQQRCDVVDVNNNSFKIVKDSDDAEDLRVLERECIRITKVTVTCEHGREIPVLYKQKPHGSGVFLISKPLHHDEEITECNVYYRFEPKEMIATTDTPELPKYMHSIIPYYVVAMARENSDASTQRTGNIYLQQFNEKLMAFEREARGETDSFTLLYY